MEFYFGVREHIYLRVEISPLLTPPHSTARIKGRHLFLLLCCVHEALNASQKQSYFCEFSFLEMLHT